jgi:hypothetical protein
VADVDEFANLLLEEAKRFLEKADECDNDEEERADLHAALMLAFCALDAHVNSIAMDFERRKTAFSAHERSVLFEYDVRLEDGDFVSKEAILKIWRLQDRIQFLHKRLSGKAVDKTAPWWSELDRALDLRNELTHPKKVPTISIENVGSAIQAVIDAINALYLAVYRAKFPTANRGLMSDLNF